jgi:hypothetical protein
MNCLEFRRLKLAAPHALSPAAHKHPLRCQSCRAFAASVDESEAALARVLAVPVREGLAERILLAQRHPVRPRRVAPLALAASLFLATGLGLQLWRVARAVDQADLGIQHVIAEPAALSHPQASEAANLADAVARLGGHISGPLGEVRHFGICFVGDRLGWHVVLRTPKGTATVLLLPGKTLYARGESTRGGWSAVTEPAGEGSVIVIAETPQTATRVAALLKENIRWQT